MFPKLLIIFATCLTLGCSVEDIGTPPFTQQDRDETIRSLSSAGARVTSNGPEGLYLSLRNAHVEIKERSGLVEGAYATRRDVHDFATVCIKLAEHFLESAEVADFQEWVRKTLADSSHSVTRSEFHQFKATLSRKPLQLNFTRRNPQSEVE